MLTRKRKLPKRIIRKFDFNVPGHTVHPLPQREGKGEWQVCSSQTISGFSATGYYFGRRIHQAMGVPIGLIGSNWGGTRIEPWTTLDGFKSVPELSEQAKSVAAYTKDTKVKGSTPSAIYNSMVHPLTPTPYAEPSGIRENPMGMKALLIIKRNTLSSKDGEKPFKTQTLDSTGCSCVTSEKPNVMEVKDPKKEESRPEGGDGWAKLREAQTQALDLKHTGMAVIIDLADAHNPNDIHPKNKQDVVGASLSGHSIRPMVKSIWLLPALFTLVMR